MFEVIDPSVFEFVCKGIGIKIVILFMAMLLKQVILYLMITRWRWRWRCMCMICMWFFWMLRIFNTFFKMENFLLRFFKFILKSLDSCLFKLIIKSIRIKPMITLMFMLLNSMFMFLKIIWKRWWWWRWSMLRFMKLKMSLFK